MGTCIFYFEQSRTGGQRDGSAVESTDVHVEDQHPHLVDPTRVHLCVCTPTLQKKKGMGRGRVKVLRNYTYSLDCILHNRVKGGERFKMRIN